MAAIPEEQTVELRLQRNAIRLKYTDHPVPPDSDEPNDAEKGAGAKEKNAADKNNGAARENAADKQNAAEKKNVPKKSSETPQ